MGVSRSLGHRHEFLPTNRGFDHFLGLPFSAGTGSTDHAKCGSDLDGTHWLPLFEDLKIIEAPVNLSTLATRYASAASNFIAESASRNEPFFLYLPFSHIHHLCSPGAPLGDKQWAGPAFFHKGTSGGVADAVEEMDWITGEVLRSLRESGVEES